jgi:thermostable 8-oxoguanine DNA glycosylase
MSDAYRIIESLVSKICADRLKTLADALLESKTNFKNLVLDYIVEIEQSLKNNDIKTALQKLNELKTYIDLN